MQGDDPISNELLKPGAARKESCVPATGVLSGDFEDQQALIAQAIAGDTESAVRLGDYRAELAAEALAGSSLAAFMLAKMYAYGLGIPESNARTYAWLQYAEEFADRDLYPESHAEMLDMRSVYAFALSDEDKDAAMDIKLALMKRREEKEAAANE